MVAQHKIVKISVLHMYESCGRHSYYVRATTDEGMTKEVDGHRTGSVYNNHQGISQAEARDRALIDAATWGDFLGIKPEPYVEDGKVWTPSMTFDSYAHQRLLDARRKAEGRDGTD